MKNPEQKSFMQDAERSTLTVLAISTYELGHQPLVLGRLASAFESLGINHALLDNSISNLTFNTKDDFLVDGDTLPTHLIISVPMHTATQLGREIAKRARALFGNTIVIVAVGLYANVAIATPELFDLAIPTGDIRKLIEVLGIEVPEDIRFNHLVPVRTSLPGISNYAHLIKSDEARLVGYAETTTGCAHSCLHCPVPTVHNGKFKAVPAETVLRHIDQLHREGAQHITFGDPDFLNGPTHAIKIVREMHRKHPDLTFDATIKVEHILEHPNIWQEMGNLGLQFVVSAFEHSSDLILSKLAKGHTRADMVTALHILRDHGIEVRPSLLPFTPWTDRQSIIDLIEFVFEHELLESIDPVQFSIRLLIPLNSLLLSDPDLRLGPWNSELLSFEWHNIDPQIDDLQLELSELAQEAEIKELSPQLTFTQIRNLIYSHFDLIPTPRSVPPSSQCTKPRLSESWFCCAEPTRSQLNTLG